MREFRLLLWQKFKRFRYEGRYWLKAFGYDTDDRSLANRSYGLYVVIFGAFWAFAMWLYIGEQVTQIGNTLSDNNRARIVDSIPLITVLLQAVFTNSSARSSPLKLTSQDSAYVAASPVSRGAITTVRFLQTIYERTVFFAPVLTLAVMGLTWYIDADVGGVAGLQTALLMPLILICVWGGIWVTGIWRVSRGDHAWLAVYGVGIVLLPLSIIPGLLLRSIALGELSALLMVMTVLLAVMMFVGVLVVGRGADMIRVVSESRVFGRISDLGPMAQIYALETIEEIRRSGKQSYRLPLPQAWGTFALFARSATFYIRGRRIDLLLVVVWSAAVTLLIAFTGRIEGISPLQVWAGIILLVVLLPPRPVVRVFAEDQKRPFMRQFIPANDLMLLLIDSAIPFTFLAITSAAVWLWQVGTVLEIGAILLMSLLLTLCMGVDHVRPYNTNGRFSYVQAAAVSFAVSIGVGLWLETFVATLISLTAFIGALSLYIAD